MNLVTVLLCILLIPFVCATLITIFFRKRGGMAAAISVMGGLLVMLLTIYFDIKWDGEVMHPFIEWFSLDQFNLNMGFLVDKYAVTMLFIVAFVAFWIQLFSVGYMDDDSSKGRYFAGLSIFMFSMLGIVLADNLLMLFVFWELVGFSSYALIAHYKDTKEASDASKKAFIVNRVGDFGFLVGIVWTYWHFGTVDLQVLREIVEVDPGLVSSGIALLLMCGFLGKSAQFPLQVWLPDAMAGPTPVSALIHAATMVAAGIYFLIRIFFLIPVEVLHVIVVLGVLMAIYAGLCALAQRDIKKILAYSTLSQLGFMAVGIGLGYPGLALFHLEMHAAFKALLFLGAGSVIHALHHEQDIFKMGGLFKKMPITFVTFTIGLLALCGVTFTSGYFSKDAIIEAAYVWDKSAFVILLISAFLTSLYMGRLLWIVFFGEANSTYAKEAKESKWVITLPLIVLAICSVIGGYLNIWPINLSESIMPEFEGIHHLIETRGGDLMLIILTTLAWIAGLVISYLFYGKGAKEDRLERVAPRVFYLLKSKLWFDEIYNFYVAQIQQRFANLLSFLDTILISGIIVRGSAGIVGLIGLGARKLHVGSIHVYVYWFLMGLFLFWALGGWVFATWFFSKAIFGPW